MNGMRYFTNGNVKTTKQPVIMNMMIIPTRKPNIIAGPMVLDKPNIDETTKPKMKWGPPIWALLHTLAEKVNENDFSKIRKSLLDTIYVICSNLPCPDCANHAKQYMDGINFDTIVSKDQLKNLLFQFHNSVNVRKGVPLFPRDQLDPLYSRGNLINIIQIFMEHFRDKHRSIRMIANDFHRSKIADKLQVWFQTNIQYFSL
jgi:hypothetical protein